MVRFFKSLTLREMILWSSAFAIGIVAGWFGLTVSAYTVGAFAAVFVTFRYVLPGGEDGLQKSKTKSSA